MPRSPDQSSKTAIPLSLLRGKGRVVVVVEVSLAPMTPTETPAHPMPEGLQLVQQRTGDCDQVRIALVEVYDVDCDSSC
jgi:hypothetical protein